MQTWKLKKKAPTRKEHKPWTVRILTIFFLLATVGVFAYDLPSVWNQVVDGLRLPSGAKLEESSFRLGLDLQGGTHLVYEADMSQIPDGERETALEGVKDVIERRVNAFGVSEPVVQTTSTGGTHRVIVELAGILDVSDAISQIGETPVLEFKEQGQQLDRDLTEEEKNLLAERNVEERKAAEAVLARALAGENFDALLAEQTIEPEGKDRGLLQGLTADEGGAPFVDAMKKSFLQKGQVNRTVVSSGDGGLNVFRLEDQKPDKEMNLSHILICFEGKTGCTNPIPNIEASLQIQNLLNEVTPANFTQIAKERSHDPSAASNGGDLGWKTGSRYVDAFRLASAALAKGEITKVPVETEFGYHIIYKTDERDVQTYDIKRIVMPFSNEFDILPPSSPWINTELSGKHLQSATVQFDSNTQAPLVSLQFDGEGGDLFGQLTASHVGQPIGIFLDGEAISTPVVQTAIYGGQAIITGDFTIDEAKLLAQRLSAGALPVPVDLLSQQSVGPTLGATSLSKSIQAALVGFLLVALYMIVVYRLPGLIAVVALFLFAAMNLALYRVFGVTVTLAGIAGFILSLGIAVDANVLIIERLKEELSSGRGYMGSLDEAFRRAWAAIRDGNITTLIAAAVLYWFSSSFIRGFALTLSIGVVLSMFTAIVVSRTYLQTVVYFKLFQKPVLFNAKKR